MILKKVRQFERRENDREVHFEVELIRCRRLRGRGGSGIKSFILWTPKAVAGHSLLIPSKIILLPLICIRKYFVCCTMPKKNIDFISAKKTAILSNTSNSNARAYFQ